MPRIPLIDVQSAPPEIRKAFEALPAQLNVFRALAHADTCFVPLLGFANAILFKQELSRRDRELITLQVARQERGEYEWQLHLDIALASGVSAEQIAAIDTQMIASPVFSPEDRALLAFVGKVCGDVRVGDDVFSEMSRYFPARQIVEAIIVVGFYQMLARITEVLEVEPDRIPVDLDAGSDFETRMAAPDPA